MAGEILLILGKDSPNKWLKSSHSNPDITDGTASSIRSSGVASRPRGMCRHQWLCVPLCSGVVPGEAASRRRGHHHPPLRLRWQPVRLQLPRLLGGLGPEHAPHPQVRMLSSCWRESAGGPGAFCVMCAAKLWWLNRFNSRLASKVKDEPLKSDFTIDLKHEVRQRDWYLILWLCECREGNVQKVREITKVLSRNVASGFLYTMFDKPSGCIS